VIVDTSAIISILKDEDDAPTMVKALLRFPVRRVSAGNYLEAAILTDANRDPLLSRRLDELLHDADIKIEPVTAQQVKIAREAYRDFGKGRHKAGLNFGDCFAYALAKVTREPLLFKGNDFSSTDIERART
jgi:ribonuclease VapC